LFFLSPYIRDRVWMVEVLCARLAPPGKFSCRAVSIGAHTGGVRIFEVGHAD